jgi:DNA repair exonuclease SbcCD ATPase subunit
MIVKELEAENILSIGHISISFGKSGLVLLDGWNHDDNSHNGAGKTSIFNSLAFAIYGKLPRKVTASEILRKGCKSGFARAVISIGKDEFDIKRNRPNGLLVSKNGQICPDMSQEQLEALISLTYDQFLICMYSAQTESIKLINLNDSSKKDFFLRLLNLEDFAERRKYIDSIIKTKSTELAELESSLGKVEARISAYSESLIDVEIINDRVQELDPSKLEQKVIKLSLVQKPDMSKFDLLETAIYNKLMNIHSVESQISNSRSVIKKLDNTLASMDDNSIDCPHCKESFLLDANGPTTKQHLIDERITHVHSVNELSQSILEKAGLTDKLAKLKIKKSESLSEYANTSAALVELKNTINTRKRTIDSLNEKLEKQAEIVAKISTAKKLIKGLVDKIVVLKDEILVYEAVSSALSPTGAPAYVVDSIIDRFNDKVSQYVSLVWPNATYLLQSYKENKSGDIKAKFSDQLTIQGIERSIGSLSGGELRCLSLAVDFAIIDVVETTFGISINPIILDEPFEALDSLNRERVIDVLETLSADRQILVVDHASESKAMFSSIIRVEKKDGISLIV